ncbi:CoA transferase [Alicycliphilus denitrificans]|uniref:Formyl-CoA transferase n=2 Tax=Alicycliphilus denitrificans TaxID=179636 RepID=F4G894_ALIDK|nr:CaiB/BaiF CoA-transferase family protein [Alicycliphilus denitrificans]ADU99362.1 L-carnitine dehydratase/bile acid-inducible protein F [Alicycliphilus denitrificans BC]AEB85553.1 Formyl-CoA transferase [Alicycliphilus denitrificans K601]QKD43647.1 CoA transferase [Alicycliphilus denitrificans]
MPIKPLQGVRVLDLTNVLAGPFCCHQLAHMGADVIKVEARLGGDLARQLGADVELNRRNMGVSFLAQNPGKRSITLDLKKESAKAVFRRLVRTADVVVENFRPGVMDRLGLGYAELLQENPGLVYCAISGFGQTGPLRDFPAYDQIIQGMSGVMGITGDQESAPLRVGYPIADTIGGITAAFAVASALASPKRNKGVFIDVSMLEATMATMGWAVSNHLVAGRAPQPMGNDNVTASPSGTFRTGDGLLNIAANKQEQFEKVCDVLGRPEWKQDPRFAERHARLGNRAELKRLMETELAARSADAWWQLLNAAGVPSGPVYSVPQALDHPQISTRGMVATFKDAPGVGRDIRLVRTGFKLNGEAPSVDAPPPRLGEHTDAILAELGYAEEEIASFKQQEIV